MLYHNITQTKKLNVFFEIKGRAEQGVIGIIAS